MRILVVTASFALILAACGGDAEPASSTTSALPSTPAETTENAPTTVATNAADSGDEAATGNEAPSEPNEAVGPSYDGPPAPDFELVLSDGSSIRLSDEEKPVYMVFWAEW